MQINRTKLGLSLDTSEYVLKGNALLIDLGVSRFRLLMDIIKTYVDQSTSHLLDDTIVGCLVHYVMMCDWMKFNL